MTGPNQGLSSLAPWEVKRRDPGNEVGKFHALGKIKRSRKKCSKQIFKLIIVLEYSDLKVLCHSYMYFKSVFDFN